MIKNNEAEQNVFDETLDRQDVEAKKETTSENENVYKAEEPEASENNKENNQNKNIEKNADTTVKCTEEEEELQTRFLRLAADFKNFKRRIDKEKSDIYAYANEKLMAELLDVIDNFDRAVSVDCTDKAMLEGMNMILKQLKGVLEKNGLEEIRAEGEIFDPNFHHAVLMEDVDTHKSGEISEVLQKGYMLNKKVIRPAMVKVAQ